MKKIIGFFVFILLAQVANAEIVTCKSSVFSKVRSVKLVRIDHSYQPQWLEGEIDFGLLSEKARVVVVDAARGPNLNYIDNEFNDEFFLELGSFHGVGQYPRASLTYIDKRYSDKKKIKVEMSCAVSGKINFKNYCEKSLVKDLGKNLLIAARNQNLGDVLSILSCDTDVNIKDDYGCSPILLASDSNCGTGKFDEFNAGAYSSKIVSILLDNGAIIDDLDPVTEETSLHKSTRHQDIKSVTSLIALGADYNAQDKYGFTPLMRAVDTASYLTVDALVSAGADLNFKNSLGQTAMDIATQKNYAFLFPYLVEAQNMEIIGTDDGKCSPLEFQVASGKAAKIILTSKGKKMFMLNSEALNLSLMVDGNSSQSKRFAKLDAGEYSFNCGVHGGQQYKGKIIVK